MAEGRERTIFDMVAGLPLRAKLEWGQTREKTIFAFFYLNPLQIRGVTLFDCQIMV